MHASKIRCDGWKRKYFGKWTGPYTHLAERWSRCLNYCLLNQSNILRQVLWLIKKTHRSTCMFYFGLSKRPIVLPAFSTLAYHLHFLLWIIYFSLSERPSKSQLWILLKQQCAIVHERVVVSRIWDGTKPLFFSGTHYTIVHADQTV
jgi:hypothetical protein